MPKLTITFETQDADAFNGAMQALTEIYNYREKVEAPSWKIEEGKSDVPEMVSNPESRENFVKRMIFQELVAKVTAQRQAIAAAISAQESAQVAAAFTAK